MASAMEADIERVQWETVDKNAKQALRDIRELIDYLENMKKELCLATTKLSSDESIKYTGPATEVAITGIVHAVNYLALCRARIQETDLVLTNRPLTTKTQEAKTLS